MRSTCMLFLLVLTVLVLPFTLRAQSQWDAVPGPSHLDVYELAVTPGGAVLAWQYHIGLMRSTDEGITWSRILREKGFRSHHSFFERDGVIYSEHDNAIYFSTDDGENWDSIPAPADCQLLTVTPQRDFLILVDTAIYASEDLGANWRLCTPTEVEAKQNDYYAAGDEEGNWFVNYGMAGVFRSNDKGQSWERVLNPAFGYQYFSMMYGDAQILFSAMKDSNRISTDGGRSWTLSGDLDTVITQVYRLKDNSLLASNTRTLFRSFDNGSSWTAIITSIPLNISWLAPIDEESYLGWRFRRLHRSDDGGSTWTQVPVQGMWYPGKWIDLYTEPDSLLFCEISSTWYRSSDYGTSWKQPEYPGIHSVYGPFFTSRDGTMYGWTVNDSVQGQFEITRSIDGGKSWILRGSLPIYPFSWMQEVTSFAESDDALLLFDRNGVIARSTDEGVTWNSFGDWGENMYGGHIKAVIGLQPPHANVMLAAAGARGLRRSIDGGATWDILDPGGSTSQVYGVNVFETRQGDVFLVTWDEIFRSTDQGATWKLMNTAVFPEHFGQVLLDKHDHLYEYQMERNTAQDLWLIESTDRGEHWRRVSLPLLPVATDEVMSIDFDGKNRMVLTTWFDGFFRLDASLTDVQTTSVLPEQPAITAVHPQPFISASSSAVTVRIALPVAANVDLRILDLMGREYNAIDAVDLLPGEHDFRITGTTLSPGAYMLLLRAGSQSAMRPLLVLR